MGKLLKYGGIAWALFGLYGIVRMAAVTAESSANRDTLGAGGGIAMLLFAAIFIFPGLKLAYRGHKLLQGDAHVTLRAAKVAMKMEDRERDEQFEELAAARSLPRLERPCPYCAEMILERAKVCKHCGRDVPPIYRAPEL